MSDYLDKHGKPTNDIQCAGDFDHDAHMQKVNDYIASMNDSEIETVIHDSESIVPMLESLHQAYNRKDKSFNGLTSDEWQRRLMLEIDSELIAYAERNL